MTDFDARAQALDFRRSFIVQAPAGSGKTALLIMRFLKLLTVVESSPEECLAITFTRKAANEMQARILDALEAAQSEQCPDDPHKQATWRLAKAVLARDTALKWNLLDNPARLKIQTVDALSAALARQMPLMSQLGTSPEVSEEPELLYLLAAEQLLGDLETPCAWQPALKTLIAHLDNQLELVKQLLSQLLPLREQWLSHLLGPSSKIRASLEAGLEQVVAQVLNQAHTLLSPPVKAELCELLSWTANLGLSNAHPFEGLDLSCLEPGPNALGLWQFIAEWLTTSDRAWRKSFSSKQGFPASSTGQDKAEKALFKEMKARMQSLSEELSDISGALECFIKIKHLPSPAYSEQQWRIVSALTDVLPILCAHLKVVFQEQGQVDFVEIALSAQRALQEVNGPSDLALALDVKIRHILVDEFQDTSLAQARLIGLLVQGWEGESDRSLFLVGDPMQSIYRFRQAEVGLFLKTQKKGFAGLALEPLRLTSNFRTNAKVLNWLQPILQRAFPAQDDMGAGAIRFHSSQAVMPPNREAQAEFHAVLGDNHEYEAESIAQIIKANRLRDPDETCAILVRNRNHLKMILPELKRQGIPYQGVDIEPLFERPLIQDLLALTQALLDLCDRTHWLAILRAPWCGLKLEDLYVLSESAGHKPLWKALQLFETLDLSTQARVQLRGVMPALNWAIESRGRAALREWITEVWHRLGGPECLSYEYELNEAETFFDLLEVLSATQGFISLKHLRQRLNRLYAKPDVTEENPVQIMTIHKSKGLEFDTVIMPGLGRKPNLDPEQLLLWALKPTITQTDVLLLAPIKPYGAPQEAIYYFLNQERQSANVHESVRLLYVGATRARQRLHWFGHVNQSNRPSPHKGSLLELVWDSVKTFFASKDYQATKTSDIAAPSLIEKRYVRIHQGKRCKQPTTPIESVSGEGVYSLVPRPPVIQNHALLELETDLKVLIQAHLSSQATQTLIDRLEKTHEMLLRPLNLGRVSMLAQVILKHIDQAHLMEVLFEHHKALEFNVLYYLLEASHLKSVRVDCVLENESSLTLINFRIYELDEHFDALLQLERQALLALAKQVKVQYPNLTVNIALCLPWHDRWVSETLA